jgi:hypothetical protein
MFVRCNEAQGFWSGWFLRIPNRINFSERSHRYVQDPDGDFPWPKNGTEAAKFWVVVIDYHS